MMQTLPNKVKQSTAPEVPTSKRKPINWKKVGVFIACQLLAILAVEFVLFLAGLGEEEIFRFDKEIGFRHIPNKRVTWRTEGFAQSQFDADGLRQPGLTIAKPANTYRVAVLGDSMVEGLQVPIDKTFGEILAKRLTPINGKNVQFLNFGTSGYSTVQECIQLKSQVMKYQPDLVVLCYNDRDVFENWSPPDQVITNVRPSAVRFAGYELVIDTWPVRRWMRSPRGQFMMATAWLRENSRIAGLLTALDLEWSQHNPWYRAVIDFFSHPKQALADLRKALTEQKNAGPSFQIKFFEDNGTKKAKASAPVADAGKHTFNSASTNESLSKAPQLVAQASAVAVAAKPIAPAKPVGGPDGYRTVITSTLDALIDDMNQTCQKGGAKLVLVSLAAKAQLCPAPGSEAAFAGIDYPSEITMVRKICQQHNLCFFDLESLAETLPEEKRQGLFYAVHLTPEGQMFFADGLQPFIRQQLESSGK